MQSQNIDKSFISRLEEVGAPPRHLSLVSGLLSKGEPQHKKVSEALVSWRADNSHVFLSGPPLSYKTTITVCMMWESMMLRRKVFRLTLDDLVSMTTSSWNSREQYLFARNLFRSSHLLIVDDVGKETCGEKLSSSSLSKVITEKQDYLGQIVIVSHIPKSRLSNYYSPQVVKEIESFKTIKTV